MLEIAIKRGPGGADDWPLERIYDMLPLLAPLKDRLGGQLPGGEQQMLTVGRALMGNPETCCYSMSRVRDWLRSWFSALGILIETLRALGRTIVSGRARTSSFALAWPTGRSLLTAARMCSSAASKS
jgi:branched-chain amino acid transport system ATP-binding protein